MKKTPSAKSKKKAGAVAKKGTKPAQKKPRKKADVGMKKKPQAAGVWLDDESLFQERLRFAHEAEMDATCDVELLALQALSEQKNDMHGRVRLARENALERLVKIGNKLCGLLAQIVEQQPDLATSVASKAASWPFALRDIPNREAELKAMLKRLKIGQATSDPYDPIRGSRHPSKPKDIAIMLKLILQHFHHLEDSKEEVDHGKLVLAIFQSKRSNKWMVQGQERRFAEIMASEGRHRANCLRELTDLAAFLGRDNLGDVAQSALACMENKWQWNLAVQDLLVEADNEKLEPELQVFWHLADNDPEMIRSRHGIGQSKARVYTRNDGTTPARSRAGNIKAGINGEIRQALKSIARKR